MTSCQEDFQSHLFRGEEHKRDRVISWNLFFTSQGVSVFRFWVPTAKSWKRLLEVNSPFTAMVFKGNDAQISASKTTNHFLLSGVVRVSEFSEEKLRFASDLTAASIYDKHSVGLSIRPICTRCCFTMTKKIQVCSNLH